MRPNPSPNRHAREVRELVDETNSERLTLEAAANPKEETGLIIPGTILEATADHAADGNGTFSASGLKGSSRRFFDSMRRIVTSKLSFSSDFTQDDAIAALKEQLEEVAVEYAAKADEQT
jgi:hypothetical protein